MKKNILIFTLLIALGIAPALYLNANTQMNQTVVLDEEELEFDSLETDKLPKAIVDVIKKNYEGKTVATAAVAITPEGTSVYKVELKDAEGKLTKHLFNVDGSVYEE